MPNGTYGGVRGEETKVGQKTFVSRPTRFCHDSEKPSFSTVSVSITCDEFFFEKVIMIQNFR